LQKLFIQAYKITKKKKKINKKIVFLLKIVGNT